MMRFTEMGEGRIMQTDTHAENRSYRLLDLYKRLQQGEALTKRELVARYGVSEKTMQRDIEGLREYLAGEQSYLEAVYDKETGGYRISRESAAGMQLEEEFAVCKILLESRPFPKAVMQQVLRKLLSQVSREKREVVEKLIAQETHHYTEPQHGRDVIPELWRLAAAIREQRIISFGYTRLDGVHHERVVKPVAILFSEFYFYLIAYYADDSADYPIVFRIDRMEKICVKKERFSVPYRDRFKEGEFRKRIQFMYAGELRRILFTYSGCSLEAIRDRLPTLRVVKEEAGVYTLTAESYGKGIEMWLRTQGEEVQVLEVRKG